MPLEAKGPRHKRTGRDGVSKRILQGAVPERYEAFLTGELTVKDLDDEEIFRGQIRNNQGDFRGRPPKLVPREFATALQQEVAQRFNSNIAGLVPDSIKAIQTILNKAHPQPGDGAVVNAAFKVLERYAGKVPDTVNLKAEITSWEKHMSEVVVDYTIDDEDTEDAIEIKEIES
jgi:hypothetical protein